MRDERKDKNLLDARLETEGLEELLGARRLRLQIKRREEEVRGGEGGTVSRSFSEPAMCGFALKSRI